MAKPANKTKSKLTAYNNWGYFFVAPFVIVFCIFSVYPVLRTLYLSFTDLKVVGTPNWIWFDNYKRVITDKFFCGTPCGSGWSISYSSWDWHFY